LLFERIKKLLGQTAIYGLSSILGRLINFVLVPLHTGALTQSEFGINTDLYSIIGFMIVLTTYGMETTFFRFSEKADTDKNKVYSTTMLSIFGSTILLGILALLLFPNIVEAMRYEEHPQFITFVIVILAMDTLGAIPLAKLRAENKAFRFVFIRLSLIGVNVLTNLFFFMYCPWAIENHAIGSDWILSWYATDLKVIYIFICNILALGVMLLLLLPEFLSIKLSFDSKLWKKMMLFGIPLMIGGFAGIANELLDRQFLKYLLPEDIALAQVGIYGAVYKLSIFLVLFNQAFRYAAEPFFFSTQKEDNAKETYAIVLRYFVFVMVIGLVFIWAYIDIFKHFIDEKFWEGLYILPILLIANIMLGINLNISIWYKLIDKTQFGIIVTGIGLIFTIAINLYLIPKIGYEGAAWATLVSYAAMTISSYLLGQRFYKVDYPVGRILLYIALVVASVMLCNYFSQPNFLPQTLIFIVFVLSLGLLEKKQLMALKQRVAKK
jgi:O-antigen/teichoic acid export membrane protein